MAIKYLKSERINVRATDISVATLKTLTDKLNLSQADVIELALKELLKSSKNKSTD